MTPPSAPDRSVAVVLDAGQRLVITRREGDARYAVLPGGGVESGESPADAALRELSEETGLAGRVERHLWTIEHDDRTAHYYAVSVVRQPLALGGPEAGRQSSDSRHSPEWVDTATLDALDLQPPEIRELLRLLADRLDGRGGREGRGGRGPRGR